MCKTCGHAAKKEDSGIPNKFQSLIDSAEVKPYTSAERSEKTVEVSSDHFMSNILPAMASAARSHTASRLHTIEKKDAQS